MNPQPQLTDAAQGDPELRDKEWVAIEMRELGIPKSKWRRMDDTLDRAAVKIMWIWAIGTVIWVGPQIVPPIIDELIANAPSYHLRDDTMLHLDIVFASLMNAAPGIVQAALLLGGIAVACYLFYALRELWKPLLLWLCFMLFCLAIVTVVEGIIKSSGSIDDIEFQLRDPLKKEPGH